jgi:hypothetical protein
MSATIPGLEPRPDPQRQVDRWNELHPVGTAVTVKKDSGAIVEAETTSEAYVLGGHSAVILVTGISGSYLLERVTPAPKKPAPPTPAPDPSEVSPGDWKSVELGKLFGGEGPSVVRILDAKGDKVCDLFASESVGGKGVDPARKNAAWIIFHGPKGATT